MGQETHSAQEKKNIFFLLRNGYDYHHHHQSHSENLYVFPYFGKEQKTFVTFVFVLLAFLVCCSFRHHKNRTIKIGKKSCAVVDDLRRVIFPFYYGIHRRA